MLQLKEQEAKLSIFFHNFYGNDLHWISLLQKELDMPFTLYYNYVVDSYRRLEQERSLDQLVKEKPECRSRIVVRASPNKGKDIGGKLVLMDAYLKLGIKSDYILLLHDKHSPYHLNSQQWQKELFRIVKKEYRQKIVDAFQNDPKIGIVASRKTIRNELDNDQRRNAYTNSAFIEALKARYGIETPGLQYIAGTMFWVRASLYEDFFRQNSPLQIRAGLEEGNVLDDKPTHTHAWERLLCWLVTSKGYKIGGV